MNQNNITLNYYPFNNTMRLFKYDAGYKPKKWETKTEMQENRLLLESEQHFNPVENSSSNKGISRRDCLGEYSVKKAHTQ